MPTDELTQALDRLRFDAVVSLEQMVAEALDLDPCIVAKVLYARARVDSADLVRGIAVPIDERDRLSDAWKDKYLPDFEVRKAIDFEMRTRARRRLLSVMIRDKGSIDIPKRVFTLPTNKDKICTGCSQQITCYATNFSTPEKCWSIVDTKVQPLKLTKSDHVEVHVVDYNEKHIIPIDSFFPDSR